MIARFFDDDDPVFTAMPNNSVSAIAMSKKPLIRCPHCSEHIEPHRLPAQRKYRNEFGLDVFECPECGQNFKFDPHEYFAIRDDTAMGEGVAIEGARVDELLPSEKLAISTTRPKRFVPLLIGLGALLASGWLIIGFEGWSRYLLGVPLLAFGWVSLKTAFFARDKEIRELTEGVSEDTAKRFMDRL